MRSTDRWNGNRKQSKLFGVSSNGVSDDGIGWIMSVHTYESGGKLGAKEAHERVVW